MALGGTTVEYDRKFATPVVTHINQTDEEKATLEYNAHVEALKHWQRIYGIVWNTPLTKSISGIWQLSLTALISD
ncbi:hypothetical protein [Levilactobacillus brevis]|uniref:hypothetical protein n=1 Tax=Levilactobacillus brevis TaxID=1580 RepID=UPI000847F84E|nr:hypothetical protein [Levilactobacillus brevis]ODP93241.1 hypothetical protein BGC39_02015 [Levilactobacillus brevis]